MLIRDSLRCGMLRVSRVYVPLFGIYTALRHHLRRMLRLTQTYDPGNLTDVRADGINAHGYFTYLYQHLPLVTTAASHGALLPRNAKLLLKAPNPSYAPRGRRAGTRNRLVRLSGRSGLLNPAARPRSDTASNALIR